MIRTSFVTSKVWKPYIIISRKTSEDSFYVKIRFNALKCAYSIQKEFPVQELTDHSYLILEAVFISDEEAQEPGA